MQFIHSNKQYIERSMYLIGRYKDEHVVPNLTMEAFVAPADFNPDAQELNIVQAFAAYPDVNKKYIFSVGTSAITVLPAETGRSYAYAENGGTYTTIASGTVTWTVGSTKRNVVVIDSASTVIGTNLETAVWLYFSENVYGIYAQSCYYLKYIHCIDIDSIISLSDYCFYNCSNLTGIANLGKYITSLPIAAFGNCSRITSIIIPDSVTSIRDACFTACGIYGIILPNIISLPTGCFYACGNLAAIVIPDSVTSIGEDCFSVCGKLKSITFPINLTSIGRNAFYMCSNVEVLFSRIVSPDIYMLGNKLDSFNKETCIIHVPVGSLAAYRAVSQWNEFTNIIADL
jgi:hypothetical protein